MDPITQITAGALAAAAFSRPGSVRGALLVGAVAGALPDADVLIRSESDPLLGLQYHRHFTHALIFAPVIGLVAAAFIRLLLFRGPYGFKELGIYGTIGALTHGPIDACTSYGTLLYWPFSNHRESWDIISIIDPVFTLPLLLGIIFTFWLRRAKPARVAALFASCYLVFGIVQRERAEGYLEGVAEAKGHHEPAMVSVRPSFANLVLWRLIYRTGDRYHVSAVNLTPFKSPKPFAGGSVEAFTTSDTSEIGLSGSRLENDIERFRFFSQGYLYVHPGQDDVIGDLRYAIFPNSLIPLWGIRIDPAAPDEHVEMAYFRKASAEAFTQLWAMITGNYPSKD